MSTVRADVAAAVALAKSKHPERYCDAPRCLWRRPRDVDGRSPWRCPRHR